MALLEDLWIELIEEEEQIIPWVNSEKINWWISIEDDLALSQQVSANTSDISDLDARVTALENP